MAQGHTACEEQSFGSNLDGFDSTVLALSHIKKEKAGFHLETDCEKGLESEQPGLSEEVLLIKDVG